MSSFCMYVIGLLLLYVLHGHAGVVKFEQQEKEKKKKKIQSTLYWAFLCSPGYTRITTADKRELPNFPPRACLQKAH